MLGKTVSIETLDGREDIEIESGITHGDEVKIKGHGLPGLRNNSRGDLHAVVNLQVPHNLTAEQRDLLDQFAATVTETNLKDRSKEGIMSRLRRALR
jgi:molecular chaperone DnaJ